MRINQKEEKEKKKEKGVPLVKEGLYNKVY